MSKQKKLKRASESKASRAAPEECCDGSCVSYCSKCDNTVPDGVLLCSECCEKALAAYKSIGADPRPPHPRGRPKNPNARKNHLAVYVSDEDMQTARVESQKARMTMSDWAREILFGGAAKRKDEENG